MTKTIFQQFVDRYFQYRQDIMIPLERKWSGWDGNAIRKILDYLLKACDGDQKKAYQLWDYLLLHIDRGTPFHQRVSLHPATFARYIAEILAYLNPYGKFGKTDQDQRTSEVERYKRNLADRLNRGAGSTSESD